MLRVPVVRIDPDLPLPSYARPGDAGLDLRAEPMVLSVPAVTDRFYHFQLEDLWGQNVHYVGVRATGTGPGTLLLQILPGQGNISGVWQGNFCSKSCSP